MGAIVTDEFILPGGLEAVQRILDGEAPLAEYHKGDYGCAILRTPREIPGKGVMVYLRTGWEPAPLRWWMDQPETHWNLSPCEYRKLPLRERAALECREQVDNYCEKQFEFHWLAFYYPEEARKLQDAATLQLLREFREAANSKRH